MSTDCVRGRIHDDNGYDRGQCMICRGDGCPPDPPALRSRPFPMQGGPAIPWTLAEEIWRVYAALGHGDQSVERIAERGGFGWSEVPELLKLYRRKFGKHPEGWK